MTVYFFYGKEDFDIELEIEKIKSEFLGLSDEYVDVKIENNPNYLTLQNILLTKSLFSNKSIISINCEKYFFEIGGSKFNFSDKELNALEELLKNIDESFLVFFVCKITRDYSKKIDTRRKIYKILSKNTISKEFNEYKSYDNKLIVKIGEMAKKHNLKIDKNTITALIKHTGVNLRTINSQLEKLQLYKYPENKIEKQDILNYCNSTIDIFNLMDKIFKSNKDELFQEISNLKKQMHPLEIFAFLQNTVTNLLFIKRNINKMSTLEMSRQIGIHEYIVKVNSEKITNIPQKYLEKLKLKLIQNEKKLKTGEINENIVLEITLCV